MKTIVLKALAGTAAVLVIAVLVALPFKQTQFLILRARFHKAKNMEAKVAAYSDFVRKNPYFIPARQKLAAFYTQLVYLSPQNKRYYEDALEQLNVILKLDASNKEALLALADLYITGKQFAEAEKILDKMVKAEPKNSFYLFKRGLVYYWQGDERKAMEEAKKAIQYNQSNAPAYLLLGSLYEKQGDLPDALAQYVKALGLSMRGKNLVQEIQTRSNLGRLYLRLGLFFDGIENFEQMTKLSPRYPEAYMQLASAYYYLGLFDKAIGALDRLLKITLRMPDAYKLMGLCYLRKADYAAALSYFKKAQALGVKFDGKFINELEEAAKKQAEKIK